MNKNKGLFITFEGIDGCGKTTQLNMLQEYLKKCGYAVLITWEPGANQILCEKIRHLLLYTQCEMDSRAEMFLFLADRAQHINKFILPALKQGKIVLCDRHIDSTLAYQGYGRNNNLDEIIFLNNIATNGIKPDLTLLYDIDLKTSNLRVGKEKDRMENQGDDFLKRVREGYLDIAQINNQRIKIIDGCQNVEDVFLNTKNVVNDILKSKFEEKI